MYPQPCGCEFLVFISMSGFLVPSLLASAAAASPPEWQTWIERLGRMTPDSNAWLLTRDPYAADASQTSFESCRNQMTTTRTRRGYQIRCAPVTVHSRVGEPAPGPPQRAPGPPRQTAAPSSPLTGRAQLLQTALHTSLVAFRRCSPFVIARPGSLITCLPSTYTFFRARWPSMAPPCSTITLRSCSWPTVQPRGQQASRWRSSSRTSSPTHLITSRVRRPRPLPGVARVRLL